jgi:D-alanyl-D-alanine carboxypeptidase
VALNSDKCREDVESILNYGFHDFERVLTMHKDDAVGNIQVPNAVQPVPVEAATDAITAVSRWKAVPKFTYRVTPLPALPAAPIAPGTKLGTISILSGGVVQETVDAVATQAVAARPAAAVTARHLPTEGGLFRGFGQFLAAVALIILGGRIYARTVAKGSGSSRDRVASQLRGTD